MAINKTLSVRYGLDVANTIIVDSDRNLSNIANANIANVISDVVTINNSTNPASTITRSNTAYSWDYNGGTLSVSAQESGPSGLYFDPSGTRMYICGTTGDDVNQYTLSTPWQVNTASFVRTSAVLGDTSPSGIFFKSDGTVLYLTGDTTELVFQYTLSEAWNVATTTLQTSYNVSAQDTSLQDLYIKPDGAKMYVVGAANDRVYEYNLGTAWDVSTASFVQFFSVTALETTPAAIDFDSSGTKMWVAGYASDRVLEYDLSSAWNISTAVLSGVFYVGFEEGTAQGIWVEPSQNKTWITGSSSDSVIEYSTNTSAALVKTNNFGVDSNRAEFRGNVHVSGVTHLGGGLTTLSFATIGSTTTLQGALTASATNSTWAIGTSQTSGEFQVGGVNGTGNIFIGRSVSSQNVALANGAVGSGNTKNINIGTGGISGSNTNILLGSNVSGARGNTRIVTPSTIVSGNLMVGSDDIPTSNLHVVGNANITVGINTATINATTINTSTIISTTSNTTTLNVSTANITTANITTLSAGGGTFSGQLNVNNDLNVTGNIYLNGNTTYINVATYSVDDPLIYIAANNELNDLVDIGFIGGKNTSGTYSHTGFARDATDGKWKLFDGLPDESHVGNVINFANSYLATIVANVEANTLTVVNGVSGNVNFDSGTLFVDSVSNRVGIGTSNPTSNLHVVGNVSITNALAPVDALNLNNNSIVGVNNLRIQDPGPNEGIAWDNGNLWTIWESPNDLITNSAGNLQFANNGVRRLTLNSSGSAEFTGNVGIGISTPTSNLHVVGNANITVGINTATVNATTINAQTFITSTGANLSNAVLKTGDTMTGQLVMSGTSIWSKPNLTGNNATALQLGRFVDSDNPAYLIRTDDANGDFMDIVSNRYNMNFRFRRQSAVGEQPVATINSLTGQYTELLLTHAYESDNITRVYFSTNSSSYINANNTSANFGIGTAAPTSKLHVIGTANVTANLTVGAGSAAAPSLTTAGDDNTGIFFPTADNVSITAAGTEQVRVFGTASATDYVELRGGGSVQAGVYVSPGGSSTNPNLYLSSKGSGSIQFFTNGAGVTRQLAVTHTASAVNYLQLTGAAAGGNITASAIGTDSDIGIVFLPKANGNFGIGISTPQNKLDISYTNSTTNLTAGAGTATNTGVRILNTDATLNAYSHLDLRSGGSSDVRLASVYRGTNQSDFVILNDIGNITLQEQFRITSTGNVGIAISNPTSNLHVIGTANVSANLTVGAGSAAAPSLTTAGDNNTGIFFPSADNLSFTTAGTERARFFANGWFGYGTTTPATGYHIVSPGFRLESTTGEFEVSQSVSGWTNSTYHRIIQWLFNGTYDDHLYFASGGNAAVTNQSVLIVSENSGLLFGKGNTSGNTVLTQNNFSVTNSGTGYFRGNVGISTTNPTSNLHVVGNANITLGINTATVNATTVNATTFVTSTGANLSNAVLKTGDTMTGNLTMSDATINTVTANISTIVTGNALTLSTGTGSNSNIIFSANGSEQIRVTNTRLIGVGTATPNSNITVVGNIWATTGINASTLNVSTANITSTIGGGSTLTIQPNVTISQSLIVTGNLSVLGNTTTLNTETLVVEDADIVLLSNVTSTPALNAGIIVNRGSSTNTFLRWNEDIDKWGWSDNGTAFYSFDTALAAYSQANSAYAQANLAYDAANNAQVTVYQNSASSIVTNKINFVNTTTITVAVTNDNGNANIALTAVGGAAYDAANAAANVVAVYANDSLAMANANVNFNNTATVNVSVTANATNKRANIQFEANSTAIAGNRVLKAGDTMTGPLNVNYGNGNVSIATDPAGYGVIELGGNTGAFIDMKSPFADDYDFRIITIQGSTQFISNNAAQLVAFTGANVNFDSGTLFVDSVGNRIGIGNTAPAYALQVSTGATAGTGASIASFGTSASPSRIFLIDENATGSIPPAIYFPSTSFGGGMGTASGPLIFYTGGIAAGNEKVRIDANGQVLIGMTTPTVTSSTRLFVTGDFTVAGSNRSILSNLYYDINAGVWKYAANGYGWGFRENSLGSIQLISAPNNTGGAGVTATVNLSNLITANVISGNVGIGAATPLYKLEVNGSFAATTKSFVIDHPTKSGMKLRYGSLEGPENGVYVRGKLTNSKIIELPDYWVNLVDEESITVNLTPLGKYQKIYVKEVLNNRIYLETDNWFGEVNCYYTVFAERKDVEKIKVEY